MPGTNQLSEASSAVSPSSDMTIPATASRTCSLRWPAAARTNATRTGMRSGLVATSPARKRFATDAELTMLRAAYSPASHRARGESGETKHARNVTTSVPGRAGGLVPSDAGGIAASRRPRSPDRGNRPEIVDRLADQGREIVLLGLADPALKSGLEGRDACLRRQRRGWLRDAAIAQRQGDRRGEFGHLDQLALQQA